MTKQEALEKAREARAYYATPKGRRERLAQSEAELSQLGAEIDDLHRRGEPVPWPLREKTKQAAHRCTAMNAAIIREKETAA